MIDVVTWEDPVIGVQVEPFNWRLRKARQARGWSRAELARQAGIASSGAVGDAEKLRHVSANVREKLAITLEIPEDELFPGVIDDLPRGVPGMLEVPFTEEDVERWQESRTLPELSGDLGDRVDHSELRAAVEQALDTLTPRESRVLRLRYGIGRDAPLDLMEVGRQFGMSRERARQIESEALRKLRRPHAADYLRAWQDDWPDLGRRRPSVLRNTPTPIQAGVPPFLAWVREMAEDETTPKHVRGIAGVALADDCFKGAWEPDALRAHIAAAHCDETGFWPVFNDFIAHFNRRDGMRRKAGGV